MDSGEPMVCMAACNAYCFVTNGVHVSKSTMGGRKLAGWFLRNDEYLFGPQVSVSPNAFPLFQEKPHDGGTNQ